MTERNGNPFDRVDRGEGLFDLHAEVTKVKGVEVNGLSSEWH